MKFIIIHLKNNTCKEQSDLLVNKKYHRLEKSYDLASQLKSLLSKLNYSAFQRIDSYIEHHHFILQWPHFTSQGDHFSLQWVNLFLRQLLLFLQCGHFVSQLRDQASQWLLFDLQTRDFSSQLILFYPQCLDYSIQRCQKTIQLLKLITF
jgi:hypothetical protein